MKNLIFIVCIKVVLLTYSAQPDALIETVSNDRTDQQKSHSVCNENSDLDFIKNSRAFIDMAYICWDEGYQPRALELFFLAKLRFNADNAFFLLPIETKLSEEKLSIFEDIYSFSQLTYDYDFEPKFSAAVEQKEALTRALNTELLIDDNYSPGWIYQRANDQLYYAGELEFRKVALHASEMPQLEFLSNYKNISLIQKLNQLNSIAEKKENHKDSITTSRLNEHLSGSRTKIIESILDGDGIFRPIARLIEYGRYLPAGSVDVTEHDGVSHGLLVTSEEYIHFEETIEVPLEWDTSFGVYYEIAGIPSHHPVEIIKTGYHPPLPDADGNPITSSSQSNFKYAHNGIVKGSILFTFVEGFSVACGEWLLEVSYKEQILLHKEMIVSGCTE